MNFLIRKEIARKQVGTTVGPLETVLNSFVNESLL